ncbi:MAG: LysM peptidoglycan-binding domain-containing protein, partial [Myxococcaceae bacterium]
MSYRIQPGDTLGVLARRFGTTVSALAKANGIKNVNLIRAGATLNIPGKGDAAAAPAKTGSKAPSTSYRVRSGDTLSGIAGRFGTSVSALARANGIKNVNLIHVGDTLRIPGKGDSYTAPASGPKPGSAPTSASSKGQHLA